MNYKKIYESIIQKAKSENRIKLRKNQENYIYYENHHILPKCLGGTEEEKNKVLLTAREHFICHKLLTYIYPDNRKIASAFHYMTFTNKKYNATSKDYAFARQLFSLLGLPEEVKKKIGKSNKGKTLGKKHSKEHVEKIANANRNKHHIPMSDETKEKIKKSWILRKLTPFSTETRKKMSESRKGNKNPNFGKKHSLETKEKISKKIKGRTSPTKGLIFSEEIKNNMSSAAKNRKQIKCPYCDKFFDSSSYTRYHGVKCKLNNNKF